ncbi:MULTISPECIES: type VI secretion system lipoprotein TssJ [unclassified Caballeronia]|uniref:type VI secretion system lipoprotein TssJ n=1 Tax=unclassified Caballeronia TaxID=2646786 RepID=UPI00158C2E72|nr:MULTISPECIES: type VI secretion system lipoprotein TssJ [unclassified Caballeronia]QSN64221.1 type VI secretion system lipoprotein TssJ [Caballeronia sp. M1242]
MQNIEPKSSFMRFAAALVVVTGTLAVAACKSPPPAPPPPTIVHIDVNAIDKVNPDHSGRPSPVLVRVYELKATSSFDSADFFTLYGKDQATLGADLNAKNEFLLKPGEKQSVEQLAQPGTKFIAVVAAYRDIERARWRATAPVPPNQTTIMSVRIDTADVSITAQPAPAPPASKKKAK